MKVSYCSFEVFSVKQLEILSEVDTFIFWIFGTFTAGWPERFEIGEKRLSLKEYVKQNLMFDKILRA